MGKRDRTWLHNRWKMQAGQMPRAPRAKPHYEATYGQELLIQWMKDWGVGVCWLARMTGWTRERVTSLLRGSRRPSAEHAAILEAGTQGFVPATSWMLPAGSCPMDHDLRAPPPDFAPEEIDHALRAREFAEFQARVREANAEEDVRKLALTQTVAARLEGMLPVFRDAAMSYLWENKPVSYAVRDDASDAEIERAFSITKQLRLSRQRTVSEYDGNRAVLSARVRKELGVTRRVGRPLGGVGRMA